MNVITELSSNSSRSSLWDSDVLVILDSSFNPPTQAHGAMVLGAAERQRRESPDTTSIGVLFMLATKNADKGGINNDINHRIEMMKLLGEDLAVADNYSFGIVTTPNAIFVDKLNDILEKKTSTQQGEIVFILGYDTVARILDQKYYKIPVADALDTFMKRVKFYVLTRGDSEDDIESQENLSDRIKHGDLEGVPEWWGDRIIVESLQQTQGISSTKARSDNQDLTKSVQEYINRHHLYS